MAKPGEYDFVPLAAPMNTVVDTLSVGVFQWIYKADGHGLKKSKAVYRVKGPAKKWQEINNRVKFLCDLWNSEGIDLENVQYKRKKSETI